MPRSKNTQGPWMATRNAIYPKGRSRAASGISTLYDWSEINSKKIAVTVGASREENEANARIMAASLGLVETVELALKRLDELAEIYNTEHYSKRVRNLNNAVRAALREQLDNLEDR